LSDEEAGNFIWQSRNFDFDVYQSIKQIIPRSITLGELTFERFSAIKIILDRAGTPHPATGAGLLVFRRKKQPTGPMAVFGYDYFEAEWAKQAHATKPKLLDYEGLWGSSEEYAYEVLNFADGNRNAQQIRGAVSAEYGPVPLDMVVEYLKALEAAGVVERVE